MFKKLINLFKYNESRKPLEFAKQLKRIASEAEEIRMHILGGELRRIAKQLEDEYR